MAVDKSALHYKSRIIILITEIYNYFLEWTQFLYRHFGLKTLFYLTRSVPIHLPDRPALALIFCHRLACGHS